MYLFASAYSILWNWHNIWFDIRIITAYITLYVVGKVCSAKLLFLTLGMREEDIYFAYLYLIFPLKLTLVLKVSFICVVFQGLLELMCAL